MSDQQPKRLTAWQPLLPGESIASWATRLARANAIGFHELGSRSLGTTSHSVLTADLDTLTRPPVLTGLAAAGGVDPIELQLQSLANHRHLLSASERRSPAATRWVLDRKKSPSQELRGAWNQCCPRCLFNDEEPYFRYSWRLAFLTECLIHNAALIDRCPGCSAVLDFTASERRGPRPEAWHPLSRCPRCGQDMRANATEVPPGAAEVRQLQQRILEALESRWARMPGGLEVWSGLFLDGCYRLLRQLRRPGAGQRLGDLVTGDGPPVHRLCSNNLPFEALEVDSRRGLMRMLARLLEDWPWQFVALAKRARFTLSEVRGQGAACPFWMDGPAEEHLDRTWYSPDAQEIEAARQVLEQRGIAPARTTLAGLVGKAIPAAPTGIRGSWTLGASQRTFRQLEVSPSAAMLQVHVRKLVRVLRKYCARASRGVRPGIPALQLELLFEG